MSAVAPTLVLLIGAVATWRRSWPIALLGPLAAVAATAVPTLAVVRIA